MGEPKVLSKVLDCVGALSVAADGYTIAAASIGAAGGAVAMPMLAIGGVGIAALAGYETYKRWKTGDQIERISTWLEQVVRKQGTMLGGLEHVLMHEPKLMDALPEEARGQPIRVFHELLKADQQARDTILSKNNALVAALSQACKDRFSTINVALGLVRTDLGVLQSWARRLNARFDRLLAEVEARPRMTIPLVAESEGSRFLAGARRTDLHGRDLTPPRAFLNDERPMLWWLLAGEGGSGKTRLALELCLESMDQWNVGFLERDVSENWQVRTWQDWQQPGPTLVVVDYVAVYAHEIGSIIQEVSTSRRDKLRFLLLERDPQGEWLRRMTMGEEGSNTRKERIEACRYTSPHGETLTLTGLSSAEARSTMRDFLTRTGGDHSDANLDRLTAMLFRIDPKGRPLMAMLLAEAGASASVEWDAQTLVRTILDREDVRAFGGMGEAKARLLRNLFALATMCGGVRAEAPMDTLSGMIPPAGEWEEFSNVRFFDARVTPDASERIEPDIVGECFALRRLGTMSGAHAEKIVRWAWEHAPLSMEEFLVRAARDFGHVV